MQTSVPITQVFNKEKALVEAFSVLTLTGLFCTLHVKPHVVLVIQIQEEEDELLAGGDTEGLELVRKIVSAVSSSQCQCERVIVEIYQDQDLGLEFHHHLSQCFQLARWRAD